MQTIGILIIQENNKQLSIDNHTFKHIGQVINLVKKLLWLYNK